MKKLMKNPWTIGIGTTLVGGVSTTIIVDFFSKASIWSTMKIVLNAIWVGLTAFLDFNIKVWWLLIAIVVLLTLLLFYAKYQDAKERNRRPPFWDYTNDTIKGFSWEWEWKRSYGNTFNIDGLHPVCSKCNTPLMYTDSYGYYPELKCPRCNTIINYNPRVESETRVIIRDNAKKGCYKKPS